LVEILELARADEDDDDDAYMEAYDDVNGGGLDPAEVKRARKKEMGYIHDRKVYEIAKVADALRVTGKMPIAVMWTDSNKGDKDHWNYRSRLVAKEFRRKGQTPIFAATPPLESLRALVRIAAAHQDGPMEERFGFICIGVSRALFYAKAIRDVYVRLPAEDKASFDPTLCGKLLMSMYGTQDAGANWNESFGQAMRDGGFAQGVASPCHFVRENGSLPTMVHGDDFLACGTLKELRELEAILGKVYEFKIQIAGPWPGADRLLKVLGRILTFTQEGIGYEADPRQLEGALEAMDMVDCKTVESPWAA
jgi:hypothetical protein